MIDQLKILNLYTLHPYSTKLNASIILLSIKHKIHKDTEHKQNGYVQQSRDNIAAYFSFMTYKVREKEPLDILREN